MEEENIVTVVNYDINSSSSEEKDMDVGREKEKVEPKSYRKSQRKQQKVTCGIEGCTAKPMLLQNLKDHIRAKYGTKHPKGKRTAYIVLHVLS